MPGHWEGGLILGLVSSTIDILVERTTRFTLLPHLPRMTGHGCEVRVNAIDYVVLARHATLALDAGVAGFLVPAMAAEVRN